MEVKIPEDGQIPNVSNSERYELLSEPFGIYFGCYNLENCRIASLAGTFGRRMSLTEINLKTAVHIKLILSKKKE
jgi:hypothetical protein